MARKATKNLNSFRFERVAGNAAHILHKVRAVVSVFTHFCRRTTGELVPFFDEGFAHNLVGVEDHHRFLSHPESEWITVLLRPFLSFLVHHFLCPDCWSKRSATFAKINMLKKRNLRGAFTESFRKETLKCSLFWYSVVKMNQRSFYGLRFTASVIFQENSGLDGKYFVWVGREHHISKRYNCYAKHCVPWQ